MRKKHLLHKGTGLRNIILGGQDGVVNVLGLVLGVATATADTRLVIISGVSAAFAESISMAAVAYTSTKATRDYYRSELAKEKREIKEIPELERREIFNIFRRKGFRGRVLASIVHTITGKKKLWHRTMMKEELKLEDGRESPASDAFVVGTASMVGSVIPLLPFFLGTSVLFARYLTVALCIAVLFFTGMFKARVTIGSPLKAGIEMAVIGLLSAVAGYAVGLLLGHF